MGVRRGRAWPAGQSPRTSHPNAGPENPRVQHYGQATARPRGESYAFGGKGRKYLLEPEQGHLEREHKGRLVHQVTMPSATLRGRSSTAASEAGHETACGPFVHKNMSLIAPFPPSTCFQLHTGGTLSSRHRVIAQTNQQSNVFLKVDSLAHQQDVRWSRGTNSNNQRKHRTLVSSTAIINPSL